MPTKVKNTIKRIPERPPMHIMAGGPKMPAGMGGARRGSSREKRGG